MATTLMNEPCGDACGEETEYVVTFGITSLEMTDAKKVEQFNQVFIIVAWSGMVSKLRQTEESDEFTEQHSWEIHLTPHQMSQKLKASPIMLNLVRGCDDLGNAMLPITECFSDALLCEDFNSETVVNDFKFVLNDQQNGTMKAFFRVQKLLDDGVSGSVFKSMKKKLAKTRRKTKKQTGGANDEDFESDDDDSDEDGDHDRCNDFACPEELTEQCKLEMGLDRNFYRIINGNLINMKNKAGPCGAPCETGRRLTRDAKKASADAPIFSTRFKFKDCLPKCNEIFGPPSAKLSSKSLTPFRPRPPCSSDWIDRNINEEELLRKLCKKYGIDVDDLKDDDSKVEQKGKKAKKTKKSKTKCASKAKCKTKAAEVVIPEKIEQPKTCEPKKKSRIPKIYSFKYGNQHSVQHSCLHIEKGAGDSLSVPRNMSWCWDKGVFGIGKPWTPGQINPTVRCLMKHALNPFPYDTIPLTRRDKFGRIIVSNADPKKKYLDSLVQKPTIEVKKKDGQYCIVMNPLKDKKSLGTDCNPYLECSPFKFTIKKHPEATKKHRAKKILRSRGLVKKCSCTSIECCRCKSQREKQVIGLEMKKVSRELDLKTELVYEDLCESSDSEAEMHFTTPSARVDRTKWKPDVIHCETQYGLQDFLLKSEMNGKARDGVKACPSRSYGATNQRRV